MGGSFNSGISLTVLYKGKESRLIVKENEYYSLMSLINNELDISGFGLCNGMGSCGTCQILINNKPAMACEVAVSSALNGAYIEIGESRF